MHGTVRRARPSPFLDGLDATLCQRVSPGVPRPRRSTQLRLL